MAMGEKMRLLSDDVSPEKPEKKNKAAEQTTLITIRLMPPAIFRGAKLLAALYYLIPCLHQYQCARIPPH